MGAHAQAGCCARMAKRRAHWCSRVAKGEEAYITSADVRTWTGTGVTAMKRRRALRTWTGASVTDLDRREALRM